MTTMNRLAINSTSRRGATLVLILVLMVVLIGMVAFAVDMGRMYLVSAQMQTAVDSGALAAALQLKQEPDDVEAAQDMAKEYVRRNRVGWLVTIPEDAITVDVGQWDVEKGEFSSATTDLNAIRVSATREDEPLFFAGVFGKKAFTVPRDAVAASESGKADIIMTLDLSGSMSSQGRIGALQTAAPAFATMIEDYGGEDRIGVFGYGAIVGKYKSPTGGVVYTSAPKNLWPSEKSNDTWAAVLEAPLTDNFASLRSGALSKSRLSAGKYNNYTPIGASIRDSAHYLNGAAREDVEKVIVLMSDGHANKPNGDGRGYALEMADYAATLDIKIFTISLGNAADDNLMAQIAAKTGGEFFKATGGNLSDELTDAFRKVAGAINGTRLTQ